jgi:hypothetical protein
MVLAFDFLKANDVRLPLGQPGHQGIDALPDRINVPSCYAHKGSGR